MASTWADLTRSRRNPATERAVLPGTRLNKSAYSASILKRHPNLAQEYKTGTQTGAHLSNFLRAVPA
jgi:hypothetical protein